MDRLGWDEGGSRLRNAMQENGEQAPARSPFKIKTFSAGLAVNLAASVIWAICVALWTVLHHHRGVLGYALPWGIAVFLAGLLVIVYVSYMRLRRDVRTNVPVTKRDAGERDVQAQIPGVPVADLQSREIELARIKEFINDTTPYFLTLWGTGGIGKSALAGAALFEAQQQGFQVAFVELDKTRRLDDFIVRVAKRLNIELAAGQPPDVGLTNALYLRPDRTVIVLDNVDNIAKDIAQLIDKWASSFPIIRFILTSRNALNSLQESLFRVLPLGFEPDDSAPERRTDAEKLFIMRAQRLDSSFPRTSEEEGLVREICQAVEGLPLLILLGAGYVGKRSPAEILGQLDSLEYLTPGVPRRQKTLEALIDWSTDNLDPAARELLRQLSVVGGAFNSAAVTAIAKLPEGVPSQPKLLDALVDASLLDRLDVGDASYYRMRAEVRTNCRRYLEVHHMLTADLLHRYEKFYTERALEFRATDNGPDMRSGLDQLDADYDAILDVLRRIEDTEPVTAARIAICLSWLVEYRRPGEDRIMVLCRIADQLAGRPDAPAELQVEVAVEIAIAYCDLSAGKDEIGNLAAAENWCQRAIRLGRSADSTSLALALRWSGWLAWRLRRTDDAREAFAEAERLWRHSHDWANAAEAAALSSQLLPNAERGARIDQAVQLLGHHDAPRSRFYVLARWIQYLIDTQQIAEADGVTRNLTELTDRVAVPVWQETALHARGYVLSELGYQSEAAEAFKRLEMLYRKRGAIGLVVRALGDQSGALLRRPDATPEQLQEAIMLTDKAIELLGPVNMQPTDTILYYTNRSYALLRLEICDEAILDSDRVAPLLEGIIDYDPIGGFIAHVIRARVLCCAGRDAEAQSPAQRAMEIARQYNYRANSPGPQISEHMQWLARYLADSG
jgi:predicted ATPase